MITSLWNPEDFKESFVSSNICSQNQSRRSPTFSPNRLLERAFCCSPESVCFSKLSGQEGTPPSFLRFFSLEIVSKEALHAQGQALESHQTVEEWEQQAWECHVQRERGLRTFPILFPELTRGQGQVLHLPQLTALLISSSLKHAPLEALLILVLLQNQPWIQKRNCGVFCIHVFFGAPPKVGGNDFEAPKGLIAHPVSRTHARLTQKGCQDSLGVVGRSPNFPVYLNNPVKAPLLSDPECGKSCQGEGSTSSSFLRAFAYILVNFIQILICVF